MIQYIKVVLLAVAVVLLAWLLPWGYDFVTSKPADYPFTLYSCVTHSFASVGSAEGKTAYRDNRGNVFTDRQFDSILPTFFYRQLAADGRLPRQIEGRDIDMHTFREGNFTFRHSPKDINAVKTPLYPLLEAMSGRVDLEMPDDVFRMTERMEFVEMAANRVREEKSRLFTAALTDKGFSFPVRYVAGNPTTRKEYDEGYFMVDDAFQVFHVKRLRDRPFVRRTGISADLRMKYIFPTEFRDRKFYGLFSDAEHRLYVLETKSYALKQLPVPAFDPEKEGVTIMGDPFYWTLQISSDEGRRLYAIRPDDYSLADTMTFTAPEENLADRAARYLFPFKLSFTSFRDKFVCPRVTDFSLQALILNILLAGGYMVYQRKNLYRGITGGIVLLLTGIFGLLPLVLYPFVRRS